MSEPPLWLFGDQLGPHVHATEECAGREIVLVESSGALGRKPFHRQKLHLMLSGMRHLAEELGDRVSYLGAGVSTSGSSWRFGRGPPQRPACAHAAAGLVDLARRRHRHREVPLDRAGGVRDRCGVHQIPRLMILGDHAAARVRPGRAQRVVRHVVRRRIPVGDAGERDRMSQHADGGAMATKPYSAGGAYLNRMTDHCRGCAFDPKVRVGRRHARSLPGTGKGAPPPGAVRRPPDEAGR